MTQRLPGHKFWQAKGFKATSYPHIKSVTVHGSESEVRWYRGLALRRLNISESQFVFEYSLNGFFPNRNGNLNALEHRSDPLLAATGR